MHLKCTWHGNKKQRSTVDAIGKKIASEQKFLQNHVAEFLRMRTNTLKSLLYDKHKQVVGPIDMK
ncbi:MAG: hypothetical protein SGJ20_02820 [Planctomycetota bacterium]|nr:hypothetical protein [Planctomycetota bacterium]